MSLLTGVKESESMRCGETKRGGIRTTVLMYEIRTGECILDSAGMSNFSWGENIRLARQRVYGQKKRGLTGSIHFLMG